MLLLPEKEGFLESLWLLGVVALRLGESRISPSMGDERGEASSASAMAGTERSPLTVDLVSGVETGVEVSSSILAGGQGWACTLVMNPYSKTV